ncbi:MAG: hypothetical protein FRX49_05466 [Trebouxia sp. A1-2]|nr:MAG: hypothetical protein FRX49_05466 [Trebouxia sp. A1-2]
MYCRLQLLVKAQSRRLLQHGFQKLTGMAFSLRRRSFQPLLQILDNAKVHLALQLAQYCSAAFRLFGYSVLGVLKLYFELLDIQSMSSAGDSKAQAEEDQVWMGKEKVYGLGRKVAARPMLATKHAVTCALRLLLPKLGSRLITGASGLAYQFQQRQTARRSLLSCNVMKMGCSPSSRKIHIAPQLHRMWCIRATGANADTDPLTLLIVGDLGWLTEQGL